MDVSLVPVRFLLIFLLRLLSVPPARLTLFLELVLGPLDSIIRLVRLRVVVVSGALVTMRDFLAIWLLLLLVLLTALIFVLLFPVETRAVFFGHRLVSLNRIGSFISIDRRNSFLCRIGLSYNRSIFRFG